MKDAAPGVKAAAPGWKDPTLGRKPPCACCWLLRFKFCAWRDRFSSCAEGSSSQELRSDMTSICDEESINEDLSQIVVAEVECRKTQIVTWIA